VPALHNVQELKSFLGLLTYYGKFLPKWLQFWPPCTSCWGKDIPWKWATAEKSFKAAKDLLTSMPFIVTATQAQVGIGIWCFAYGVRAVLAHKVPDNSERLIRHAVLTESREELLSS